MKLPMRSWTKLFNLLAPSTRRARRARKPRAHHIQSLEHRKLMTVTVQDGPTLLVNGSGSDDFGTTMVGTPVQKTFTIYNSDANSINLYGISQLPQGFSVVNTFPSSVPANGSTTFTIQMDASSMESPNGQLSFYDDEGGYGSYSFNISGTVDQPPPAITVKDGSTLLDNGSGSDDFGSTTMGTPVQKTFTIYNSSGSDVNLSGLSLPLYFTLVNNYFPTSVPADGSTTFAVQMDASSMGSPYGQLNFSDNDPGSGSYSFTISGTVNQPPPAITVKDGSTLLGNGTGSDDFGSTVMGVPIQKTFTVYNSSANIVHLSGEPSLPEGFSVVEPYPTSVPANGSTTFSIQMVASSVGFPNGQLMFSEDDPGGYGYYSFNISGTVNEPPPTSLLVWDGTTQIVNDPSGSGTPTDSFGSTPVGTPVQKTFTIQNTGSSDITLTNGSLHLPVGFSLVGSLPTTVPAGSNNTTFTVQMDATSVSSPSGEMWFYDNDPGGTKYEFEIGGSVTAPPVPAIHLSVDSQSLANGGSYSFPDGTVSSTDTKTFQIQNTGGAALSISSITFPAGFSLQGSAPSSVAAGQAATFTVGVDTSVANSYSGLMTLNDNDPNNASFTVNLSGLVVMPGVTIQATTPVADEQLSTTGRFTVTRSGPTTSPLTVDYSVSGTALAGTDYVALSGSVTIPAGAASATINVAPPHDGLTKEIQQITLPVATGGTYTLAVGNETTSALAFDASAAVVQAALAALASVGAGRVGVTGSGASGDPFVVTFSGPLGGRLPQIVGDGSQLTGGSSTTIATAISQAGEFGGAVQVSLTADADYTLGSPSQDTVTVLDGMPVVTVAATQPQADEVAGTSGAFTFYRNGPTADALTADYWLEGSALDGVDYQWVPGSVTFAPGQSSVTVAIAPINNGLPGADKSVLLTLAPSSAGQGQDAYSLAGATSDTVTIVDNNLPIVSISASAPRADAKTGYVGAFTVTRSGKTDADLTVDYTIGGTAVAGTNYQALTGVVTIPAGQRTATFDVTALADDQALATSTVDVSLSASPNYALAASNSAEVKIVDDNLPQVSVDASTPLAFEQSGTAGEFTVSIDAPQAQPLTIYYTTSGTAATGTQYQTLSGQATIPAGATSATISVIPLTDPTELGARTVVVTLSTDAAYELTTAKAAIVSIVGDMSLPAVTLTATTPVADENTGTNGLFTVTRSGSTSNALTVYYTIAGSAANGTDYQTLSGNVTIPAGQASATITISPLADPAMASGSRTVQLTLTNYGGPSGASYTIGNPASGTVTVSDLPEVTIQATTPTADENTGAAGQFTVTRAGDTSHDLTVAYTVGGTAAAGDYQPLSGTVTIPAGQSSATIAISPLDVHRVGGSETVQVTLSESPAYTIGAATTDAVTILDDDPPAITIMATTPKASERTGAAGVFTVTRTGPTDSPLTVPYNVAGTGIAGTDYQALSGSVTIPAGQASATIAVTPNDIGQAGGSWTVQVTLSGGSGYVVASPGNDTVTIEDDDLPIVTLVVAQANATESGTAGSFTVTRTGTTSQPLIVLYTIGGDAVNGTDYQTLSGNVTIPAGQSSATITLTPINDPLVFADQTVQLALASASDYSVGSQRAGTVTIFDDNPPTVSIAATTPTADEETASAGQFTVTRLGAPDNPLAINYTIGGTAVAGTDYSALSGSVTIPAGESSATIDVTPIDDGGVAEVQQVIVPTATGGSFTLSVDSHATSALPYNATAAQVQAALAALVNVGTGNVTVSGSGTAANPFLVTFCGALMDVGVPQIVGDGSLLTGTASINVTTTTQGKGGVNEVQLVGYTLSGSDNGGSISFTVNGQTTYSVYCTADAATVQSALEYVLGTGNVSVVAVDTGPNKYTWQITFQGSLASQDLPQSTTNVSAIYLTSGSTATPADSTITNGGTSGAADEVQQVAITGAVGGTFTLSYGGQTTAPLTYNATASDVQSGLHLSSLGEDGVSVSGPAGGPWVITFQGELADQDVPQITADGSGLIGTTQIATSISTPADHDKTIVATLSSSSGYVLGSATSDTVTIAENDNQAPIVYYGQYGVQTGQQLSMSAGSGVLLRASDPGQNPLSAVLLSGVSHGTLTFNSDGSFDYAPAAGYLGPDSFVYQAFDGTYYSLPATVTLQVVSAPAPQIAVLDGAGNPLANGAGSDSLGTTPVGSPVSVTVSIKNTGSADLMLDPNSLVVPAGFTVVTPFASTVAAGDSTTLVIRLDAASAGQYSGAVQFTDNDPSNGAFEFTISGTVNVPAPQIAVSAGDTALANGGSFTLPTRGVGEGLSQTFTITNRGSADLTLDAGSISLPSGYSLVTPFANTVAPGNSTTLVVELMAQTAGQYDGNLQFTDNDADNSTFVVALVGSVVVSPVLAVYDGTTPVANSGSVTLGTALVGTPLTKTLTITNTGSVDLTLDPSQVTLPAGYTVTTAFATTVAPGASTSLTLQIDGSTAGDFQGTVSFPTNDPAAGTFTFQIDGQIETPEPQMVLYDGSTQIQATTGTVDFGSTPLGTPLDMTLTIENVGTADLILPPVMALPSGYHMVSLSSTDIAPGGSAMLVLELLAAWGGTYSGVASLDTNYEPDDEPFSFNLTGAVTAPQIQLTLDGTEVADHTGRVDFGNAILGNASVETFTVTNVGDGTLTLVDPIVVPLGFSVVSDFGATSLAPGASTTFSLQLDAQTAGSYGGPVLLETDDPDHWVYTFTVTGETGLPTIGVSIGSQSISSDSSDFDFGNTPMNSPVTKTFTVTNSGSGDLTLSDPIQLPDGFSLVSDFGQTELAPGASTTFAVELTAATAGLYSGDISFGNNATLSGTFRFPVSGGVGVGRLQVLEGATDVTSAANPVDFGMTVPNQPITETFTIVNTGSGDLTLSDPIGLPAGFSLVANFAATTLAPGESTSFQVELTAAAGGSFSGAITFGTNLTNQASYSLPIDGEVVDLSNFRLWNDTGYSSTDGITSDPTVAGNLSGLPSGRTVEVQFDDNGDGAADETMQAGGDTPFAFTPKDLAPGPISIAARVHLVNLALGGDLYTDWSPLSFTLETGTNAKPVVANLALQTVTVPGASTPTSSDSTITGVVYNDGNAGYMTIQVDANGDGQKDDVTTTDSSGQFVYAPQKLSPGTYTYHFRAIENDYPIGQIIGDWTAFTFIVVAPNAPVLDQLSLANVTGPGTNTTTDPTLTGHVTADGNPRQVEVDFDYNGDGVVDASTVANTDGSFTYTPTGLQPGSQTIHVRAVNLDDNIKGVWSSITFMLAAASAPSVSSLALAHDTGSSATDNITADPTVTGELSGGVGVANITVQFDTNGDGAPDGSTTSDSSGNFTFLPLGLATGSVTVSARAVATDPTTKAVLIGDWKSLTFTLSATAAPTVNGLALAHPTGTDANTGYATATDPTLVGSLSDGGALTSFMTVEYDINGDGKADGSTIADMSGNFKFSPRGLLLGTATVEVRGVARDPVTGGSVDGAWTSITFVLQQDPVNQVPTPPNAADAQTTADQVAATSQQASQQAIDEALQAFNAAMGYGSTASGQIALGIGAYTALSGAVGGRVESGSIYDAANGSLPAPAGINDGSGGAGSGSGVSGPSLPGSTPLGPPSSVALALSGLATPQSSSGSITNQVLDAVTSLGPGTNQITGNVSGSWNIVVTPDSQNADVTDWTIDIQISAPYDSALGGSYADMLAAATINHAYADDVGGTYMFTFHATGTTTSTPAGNIVAGTYTVGEKNDYNFNYNDSPVTTDPTSDASSTSAYTASATGSHSFQHEVDLGSFNSGAGTGEYWQTRGSVGPATDSGDFINVENEDYQSDDGGSGSYGDSSAEGTNSGNDIQNTSFSYYRNHFEAGADSSTTGSTSNSVSFSDDQRENYSSNDSETGNINTATEDGEVNGASNVADGFKSSFEDSEQGTWNDSAGGYQLDVTSFRTPQSDSETDHIAESGGDSENIDGISSSDNFSFDETDSVSESESPQGSYDVNGTDFSVNGASFSDTAQASSSLSYEDSGGYQGTQDDAGDNVTLNGSYSDSESENDSSNEEDDGNYNVDSGQTTDSGEDTANDTANLSYSSGGSDNANDADTTVSDSYSDTGGGNGYFNESGTFSDDASGETADGTDSDGTSASDSATASETVSTGDESSTFRASDSSSSSSNFNYHESGNYDLKPAEDDFTGDEGETDINTGGDSWSQGGSISGSNPFTFSEGGTDTASANYTESDHYTDDEPVGGTASDTDVGSFSDHDSASASETYSDSGTSTGASSSTNYSDRLSDWEQDTYDDSATFSAGASTSQSVSFDGTDDSGGGATHNESGTYSNTSESGSFTDGSTNDSTDDESEWGTNDNSNAGTTSFTISDSTHSTFNDQDGGQFTSGETGSYSDGANDDDTATRNEFATTTQGPSGSTTSGTFGDDSRDIHSDREQESEHDASTTKSDSASDYNSSSYHDSGNFTDSSLSESRHATFNANDRNVAMDGFDRAGTLGGSGSYDDGGDDTTSSLDSSDGNYTSASGTLTQTANGTEDSFEDGDAHDSQQSGGTGPSGSNNFSQSSDVEVDDHSHESGDETETNGAVTSADQDYTEDDITKTNASASRSENGAVAAGVSENSSQQGSSSTSRSFHDGGHHDVSVGTTTDSGGDKIVEHDTDSGSDNSTVGFNNALGVGSSTQADSGSDVKDYTETGSYTDTNGVETDSNKFDSHDVSNGSTNINQTVAAQGDAGTSWTSTYSQTSTSDDATNGGYDESAGAITDETDHFTDKNTDEEHDTYHEDSDKPNVVSPGAPLGVPVGSLLHPLSPWETAPEWAGPDFTPPEYNGPISSGSSTIDSKDDYQEKDQEIGTKTDVSGVTNTDETFSDSSTMSDSGSEEDRLNGSYSTTNGNGDFTAISDTSYADSETKKDGGSNDGGVTTNGYTDVIGFDRSMSATYTSNATTSSGGVTMDGHDKESSTSDINISITAAGDYTTAPSGDNDGYASSHQTAVVAASTQQSMTQQLTGDESGPGFYLSGSGTQTCTADNSVDSNAGDGPALDGATAPPGSYTNNQDYSESSAFVESGSVQLGYITQDVSYSAQGGGYITTNASGGYNSPTGTATQMLSSGNHRDTTETITTGGGGGPTVSSTGSTHTGGDSGPTAVNVAVANALTVPTSAGAGEHEADQKAGEPVFQTACFAAGTPVRTSTGSKPIEALRPGDLVLASPDGDPLRVVELKPVLETYANTPARLIHVHIGDQVIRATREHPFYVRNRGWTGARHLETGDLLLSDDGSWRPVREVFDNGDVEPVYNLHVENYRTYYIGETTWRFSVLVHNQSEAPKRGGAATQQAAKAKFTAGTGPVKIVGIYGRGFMASPENTAFRNQLEKIQANFNKSRSEGQDPASINFAQSSADAFAGAPFAGNEKVIAKELANAILDAVGEGKLEGKNVYRLLLAGYSWGGDMAIKVANELQSILEGEINARINDPAYADKRQLLLNFRQSWRDKLRVYLATEDAVSMDNPLGGPSTATVNRGAVYDRFNVWATSPDGFFDGATGFPGASKENNKSRQTDHVGLPEAAVNDILAWLGLTLSDYKRGDFLYPGQGIF